MENKNKAIRSLTAEMYANPDSNINPLSMVLQGTIDAAVQGGPKKYKLVGTPTEEKRYAVNFTNWLSLRSVLRFSVLGEEASLPSRDLSMLFTVSSPHFIYVGSNVSKIFFYLMDTGFFWGGFCFFRLS